MNSKLSFEENLPCFSDNEHPCIPCINLIKFEAQMGEETGSGSSSMLVEHRKLLKTMVNRVHDPIFRSLPLEIISLIFEFSISRLTSLDIDEVWLPDDFDHHSLLKLGAVCTAWRKVAWATPRLWTFIAIRLNASSFPTRGTVAQEWLKRSGSLPLYIFVLAKDKEDIPQESSMESFSPLIETINSLSNRWRVLHLELPIVLLQRFRPTSATGHTPLLHTLRLSDMEDLLPTTEENTAAESFTAINVAPLAVFLTDVGFRSVNIQWDRLTMVSIWTLSVNELMGLFDTASGLATCLVEHLDSSSVDSSTAGISTRTQVYSSIQNLRFGSTSVEGVKEIFKMIELPALQRLGVWAGHPDIPKILASFLQHSRCTLEYFCISVLETPWAEVASLLCNTNFKSLKRISLRDCCFHGGETTIINNLSRHLCWWEPKREPFLPNLCSLSFHFWVESADKDWESLFLRLHTLIGKCEDHNTHHAFQLARKDGSDHDSGSDSDDFPISDPEIDGPKFKEHQILQKVDLSIYVETVLDVDNIQYMDQGMVSRYTGLMERGVFLDISASIAALADAESDRIVDTVDIIHESMDKLGLPEEDMDRYIALVDSLYLPEW